MVSAFSDPHTTHEDACPAFDVVACQRGCAVRSPPPPPELAVPKLPPLDPPEELLLPELEELSPLLVAVEPELPDE
jgi:hypothetical protein